MLVELILVSLGKQRRGDFLMIERSAIWSSGYQQFCHSLSGVFPRRHSAVHSCRGNLGTASKSVLDELNHCDGA